MTINNKPKISDKEYFLAESLHPMHGEFYLNRHWKNRLPVHKLDSLITPRLLAYYHKHQAKRKWFIDISNYQWQENDLEYNSEFDMSPNKAFNYYLDQVKAILNQRENII